MGRNIDMKLLFEEWEAAGFLESRQLVDGTVEYRMTDKGKRLGGPPSAMTEALVAKMLK